MLLKHSIKMSIHQILNHILLNCQVPNFSPSFDYSDEKKNQIWQRTPIKSGDTPNYFQVLTSNTRAKQNIFHVIITTRFLHWSVCNCIQSVTNIGIVSGESNQIIHQFTRKVYWPPSAETLWIWIFKHSFVELTLKLVPLLFLDASRALNNISPLGTVFKLNLKLNFTVIGFDPGGFQVIDHSEFYDNGAITKSLRRLIQNESENWCKKWTLERLQITMRPWFKGRMYHMWSFNAT